MNQYNNTILDENGFYPEIEIKNIKEVIQKILIAGNFDNKKSDILFKLEYGGLEIIHNHNQKILRELEEKK